MPRLISLFTFGFAVVDMRILKQYGSERAAGTFAGDMIIVAASLMLVAIAIFGCVGAARENVKILYLYAGLLMTLALLELMIGIFVTVQRCGLEFTVSDWLREDFFRNYTGDELVEHNRIWDDLQTNYECCGLNGPADYHVLQQPISVSCCPRIFPTQTARTQELLYDSCIKSGDYYRQGCEDGILYVLRSDGDYLLGVAVISFWFEAAAMLLAIWIANNLKNCAKVYKHTVKY
ncbi:leukocyte antigen CD37-like [Hyposmocoma kahamanoa]|uniref:leukocyte antigen CD37-like n=1 Tax=Hyposmocoma kahamanoa TaxID=1477025 RepID=UPI000E6D8888|nr:leukocyte antigen CD37-like [Hyposmocoma kahamanoa]